MLVETIHWWFKLVSVGGLYEGVNKNENFLCMHVPCMYLNGLL
jgi:hypothetical protein